MTNSKLKTQNSKLRIAIDARYVQDYFPGIGRYTYNLIAALAALPQGPCLSLVYNPALPDRRYNLPELVRQCPDRLELLETSARPFSPQEQWQLFGLARRSGAQVWHAPYYIRPYLLPIPSVLTAHDVIGAKLPQTLPSQRARLLFGVTSRLAFASSRRIITVSQAAARDIEQFYGVKPAKMRVVPEGVGENFCSLSETEQAEARTALNLPDRYLLYVGINKPHKNLTRLLQAYRLYRQQSGDDLPLILAGKEDPRYSDQLRQTVTELKLNEAVRFWGAVSEADLPKLYACASLFDFPSLYEGFGLPVLEAMACGAPVICADNSSLPEVAGDAAILFQAEDVEGQAAAIWQGLAQATALRQKGLERARLFSWQRVAEQTLAVYEDLGTRGQ